MTRALNFQISRLGAFFNFSPLCIVFVNIHPYWGEKKVDMKEKYNRMCLLVFSPVFNCFLRCLVPSEYPDIETGCQGTVREEKETNSAAPRCFVYIALPKHTDYICLAFLRCVQLVQQRNALSMALPKGTLWQNTQSHKVYFGKRTLLTG